MSTLLILGSPPCFEVIPDISQWNVGIRFCWADQKIPRKGCINCPKTQGGTASIAGQTCAFWHFCAALKNENLHPRVSLYLPGSSHLEWVNSTVVNQWIYPIERKAIFFSRPNLPWHWKLAAWLARQASPHQCLPPRPKIWNVHFRWSPRCQ